MFDLDTESQTFEAHLPDMLKSGDGQWVVIKGDEVKQMMPTYEQALAWGYEHFGLSPFFLKQITAIDPVVHFTRHTGACGP